MEGEGADGEIEIAPVKNLSHNRKERKKQFMYFQIVIEPRDDQSKHFSIFPFLLNCINWY